MRRRSIPLVKTERSDRESIVAMSRPAMIRMCSSLHSVADSEVKDTQFRLLLGTIAAASPQQTAKSRRNTRRHTRATMLKEMG